MIPPLYPSVTEVQDQVLVELLKQEGLFNQGTNYHTLRVLYWQSYQIKPIKFYFMVPLAYLYVLYGNHGHATVPFRYRLRTPGVLPP